jgi:hypothetical protein
VSLYKHYKSVLGVGTNRKNRDNLSRDLGKQLTFIVRVRRRFYFNLTITESTVYDEKIPNPPVMLEYNGETSEKGISPAL